MIVRKFTTRTYGLCIRDRVNSPMDSPSFIGFFFICYDHSTKTPNNKWIIIVGVGVIAVLGVSGMVS